MFCRASFARESWERHRTGTLSSLGHDLQGAGRYQKPPAGGFPLRNSGFRNSASAADSRSRSGRGLSTRRHFAFMSATVSAALSSTRMSVRFKTAEAAAIFVQSSSLRAPGQQLFTVYKGFVGNEAHNQLLAGHFQREKGYGFSGMLSHMKRDIEGETGFAHAGGGPRSGSVRICTSRKCRCPDPKSRSKGRAGRTPVWKVPPTGHRGPESRWRHDEAPDRCVPVGWHKSSARRLPGFRTPLRRRCRTSSETSADTSARLRSRDLSRMILAYSLTFAAVGVISISCST